jgi:eukaryotic-like serine/threonine-protein kinase
MPIVRQNLLERAQRAFQGRFEVVREIGRGGMATVYEAGARDRRVALKVLHPEWARTLGPERFQREIAFLTSLSHPNILTILESGEAGGLLYFAMPLARGESLRQRIEARRHLPLAEALGVVRDVAAAMDYAHSRNIVHRDIKPENILFEGERALVCDFGVARAIIQAGGDSLSSSGLMVGTPEYMSPEQASGARDIDGRADVYALGCVLYEILAGEPPFTGPTAQAVLARHANDLPPPLRTVRPEVPPRVAAAVLAALEKAPGDRPQSGTALIALAAG